jgi:N-methylhydantoinase A
VRSADLRYFGQASEVRVEVPAGPLDRPSADIAVDRFHAAHERTYGYSYRGQQPAQAIEWVNVRVTGIGPIKRPPLRPAAGALRGSHTRALTGSRRAQFDGQLARENGSGAASRARNRRGVRIDDRSFSQQASSTVWNLLLR